MKIFKYELQIIGAIQCVHLPLGYKFLHVEMQRHVLCMWCLVDASADTEPVKFCVHGTGQFSLEKEHKYLGTALDDPYVWHLFLVP